MPTLTGIEFEAIYETVKEMVPVVLPTLIGFIGLRKGIKFLIGTLRGA